MGKVAMSPTEDHSRRKKEGGKEKNLFLVQYYKSRIVLGKASAKNRVG